VLPLVGTASNLSGVERGMLLVAGLLVSLSVSAADRVAVARAQRSPEIAAAFRAAGVQYPPAQLYLRAFKREGQLELWVGDAGKPLKLLRSYKVCAASGTVGPKRQRGDLQVPEGFYEISHFNPKSSFHLSMKVSYPNQLDQLGAENRDLGGDIFIHGSCASVGCLAIEDAPIEELYVIASDYSVRGRRIPVHIFPRRLSSAALEELKAARAQLAHFWSSLEPAYAHFEKTRRVPRMKVDSQAKQYRLVP
jgi:murein L,D-transpeptidase YafK